MEVAKQNCGLRASDDKDYKDQKQESKHVVHLAGPNRVEDEEELDKNASEGQDAAHDDTRNRLRVDGLLGNLPGDLICADGMFQRLKGILVSRGQHHFSVSTYPFPEAKEGADEREWNGDSKPQGQNSDQRREGHGSRATFTPQDQVQHEEQGEYNAATKIIGF